MPTFKHMCLIVVLTLTITNCEGRSSPKKEVPQLVPLRSAVEKISPSDYNEKRRAFLLVEETKSLGSDLVLSDNEKQANLVIMKAKSREYGKGLMSPYKFAPAQPLFEVLKRIKDSRLFEIISKMPKGGVLHAHDTALCSTDFVLQLTYRDSLWMCQAERNAFNIQSLKFSKQKPAEDAGCKWELLSDVRNTRGANTVDAHFRQRLTLYPKTKYEDNNEVWRDFMEIFGLLDGLLFYAPVWADYYYNALKEFYADGVQYLEFRTTLPILYDMEGSEFTALDTVRIYYETLTRFKQDYPEFIGSKLIYAPLRQANDSTFEEYKTTMNAIKDRYPDFVAGFDLVGQEEMGRPLKDFVPQLLAMRDDIDFYFHAGETNWFGSTVDENLIDAVLLGSKRIGHGYAVTKHPSVLKTIRKQNIAIELSPLSNQVLQLVSDLRNHPGASLIAAGYPVVVSSDDPSFWKATPLSHDFYVTFLGIASAHADLRLLKKLAMNSIDYSAMTAKEKRTAFFIWQRKWDEYINSFLKDGQFSACLTP